MQELLDAGCTSLALFNAGYNLQDFLDSKHTLKDIQYILNCVYNIEDAQHLEALRNLKVSGFSAGAFKDVGYDCSILRKVGFTALELYHAGFSQYHLLRAGFPFTARELTAR